MAYRQLSGSISAADRLRNYFSAAAPHGHWDDYSAATVPDCERKAVLRGLINWLKSTDPKRSPQKGEYYSQLSIIYICAHGCFDDGRFVILTSDTDKSCIFETGISLFQLYHILREKAEKGRAFLLIVDACFEQYVGAMVERLPKNVCVLFAAGTHLSTSQNFEGTSFTRDFVGKTSLMCRDTNRLMGAASLLDVVHAMNSGSEVTRFFCISNFFSVELPSSRRVNDAFHLPTHMDVKFSSLPLGRGETEYKKILIELKNIQKELNLNDGIIDSDYDIHDGTFNIFIRSEIGRSDFLSVMHRIRKDEMSSNIVSMSFYFSKENVEEKFVRSIKKTAGKNIIESDGRFFVNQSRGHIDISIYENGGNIKYIQNNINNDESQEMPIFQSFEYIRSVLNNHFRIKY